MIARRIIHAVLDWWSSRPTQRRIARVRARHIELKARIEVARSQRNTVLLHSLYPQLRNATIELLRLEQRRTA